MLEISDYNDAEAIAELALYQRHPAVPHKSIEQQDIQSLIRMRRLCVTESSRLINQVRGLIAEFYLKERLRSGKLFPKCSQTPKTSYRPYYESFYHASTNAIYILMSKSVGLKTNLTKPSNSSIMPND